MSGKIPSAFIDELLARTDIVDLIDARVPLKKAGSNYSARCPFHNEKTPSFTVSREKQFYHCFGCGAHGTAIGFLMEYDRLGFVEAVEELASRCGLPVPREGGGTGPDETSQREDIQELYDLQARVARFYAAQLRQDAENNKAVAYLKKRGVSGEIAARYGLGYAPEGWNTLERHFDGEKLVRLGLLLEKESGGRYDRFRDRVMFPIRDRRGRVVGFGGRVLDQGEPKYLNSPETPLFRKRQEVYGLFELLKTQSKPPFILVVEGYMDVVALAQYGLANVVATLGTAMSGDHLSLLFRHVSELVFCFDGDAAGRAAAWRALETALPVMRDGRSIRFLLLPDGEDPDTLIRREGLDGFQARLAQAMPLSDYFFAQLSGRTNLQSIEGRASLSREGLHLLDTLPDSQFRTLMRQRLAELARVAIPQKFTTLPVPTPARRPGAGGLRPSLWRRLTSLLLGSLELASHVSEGTRRWLERARQGDALLFRKLLEIMDAHPHIALAGLIERFRDQPEEYAVLLERLREREESGTVNVETEFVATLNQLEVKRHHMETARLRQSLPVGDAAALTEEGKAALRGMEDKIKSRKS
jgi:DNA primase